MSEYKKSEIESVFERNNLLKNDSTYKKLKIMMWTINSFFLVVIVSFLGLGALRYMESNVRGQVEVMRIDQNRVASALVRYYMDNQYYPAMNSDASIPSELTTPIDYLRHSLTTDCKYYYLKKSGVCILLNNGPDQKGSISNPFFVEAAQNDAEWIQANYGKFCYDPTNGLKSSGDIIEIIPPYKNYYKPIDEEKTVLKSE